MALFSDGPPSSIDDLTQHDSYLISTATSEGIDVTAKLQTAHDELSIELTVIFARQSSIYAPVLGQASLDTQHLAVTPALKLWHSFKVLELVYRDAYYSQLNDRYKGKWTEYQSLAQLRRGQFVDTGAGLIIAPLPQPDTPIVAYQTASQQGGTTYITVTFVNAGGEESSPASVIQCDVPDGRVLAVTNPTACPNAAAWNVYGGLAPSAVTLQNSYPLLLGAQWQYLLPGLTVGRTPGTGQVPNVTRDLPRRIMRG